MSTPKKMLDAKAKMLTFLDSKEVKDAKAAVTKVMADPKATKGERTAVRITYAKLMRRGFLASGFAR